MDGVWLPVVRAIIAGCVFALRKALRAGFLGQRLFGGVCFLWLVYVSSTVALYLKASPAIAIPLPAVALGISLLLVPLVTTAIAPLALASHRHA
jgi:cell division protein FtsW (lipid II flippase)